MKKVAKKRRKIANHYKLENLMIRIVGADQSGMCAKDILYQLNRIQGFKCSRRTVYNHLESNKFLPIGSEVLPERYVLNKAAIKEFRVDLSPLEAQVVVWAIENLKRSSTDFFYESTSDTIAKIYDALPASELNQIKNSLEVFSAYSGIMKRPYSFEKNNLEALLAAIREKRWIKAKLKDSTLSHTERHRMRKLAIGNFTFKNNIPYVIAKDESETNPDLVYKSIRATRLNSIELVQEVIPDKELGYMQNFDLNHNPEKIKIVATNVLAQIFKESVISPSQKNTEKKKTEDELIMYTEFNMRITNSFINLLLPHVRDIVSIEPAHLLNTLLKRTAENLKNLRSLKSN